MKANINKTAPNPFQDHDAYVVEVELTIEEIATFLERGRITLGDGQTITIKLTEVEEHSDATPHPFFPGDEWLKEMKKQLKKPSPFYEYTEYKWRDQVKPMKIDVV